VKSGKVKADGTDPDEEIINPINLAEADIQNKTTTFLPAVLLFYNFNLYNMFTRGKI